jgi:hypothetical protein
VGRNRQGIVALLNRPVMIVLVQFGWWSHVRCDDAVYLACHLLMLSGLAESGRGV